MKRLVLLVSCLLAFVADSFAKEIAVVDSMDSYPIIGATVIGKTGVIVGLTNDSGRIEVDNREMPVTIRCVGYDPVLASEGDETVMMTPSAFQLHEVVVTPGDRPIKRVVCFAREYSSGITGIDTMQYYCEYMTEAFIVDDKVKGYRSSDSRPTPKGTKRYARITKNGTDSIFKPGSRDEITQLSWFDFLGFLPDKKIEVPKAILAGADIDTVPGKYGPQFIYRKKNGLFTVSADVMSNHKNRQWSPFIFKLIGMTTDITAGAWSLSYVDNPANSFKINEFISGTYNIHLIGRGKWMKKIFNTQEPIEMDVYLEMYPLEITNLTVEEYKERRDDFKSIPFEYPENIKPLSPAIETLVNRLEKE